MIRFKPGQQIKAFEIIRKETTTDAKGRVTYGLPESVGELRGSISAASQKEISHWRQNEHPISHKVTVRGKTDVKAEDVLILTGRKFYVQGKDDPGELGIYTVLYCQERFGV